MQYLRAQYGCGKISLPYCRWGKKGESYVRVENDDIALKGYSFPNMNESEAIEVYITSVLDEIHDVLCEIDGLPLDHEFSGNEN